MFLTKKIRANQVCIYYYNTTHCSLFGSRKLLWSSFSSYYHKIKKAQVQFKKPAFEKKP